MLTNYPSLILAQNQPYSISVSQSIQTDEKDFIGQSLDEKTGQETPLVLQTDNDQVLKLIRLSKDEAEESLKGLAVSETWTETRILDYRYCFLQVLISELSETAEPTDTNSQENDSLNLEFLMIPVSSQNKSLLKEIQTLQRANDILTVENDSLRAQLNAKEEEILTLQEKLKRALGISDEIQELQTKLNQSYLDEIPFSESKYNPVPYLRIITID
jgi:chromosome segregation ATPase